MGKKSFLMGTAHGVYGLECERVGFHAMRIEIIGHLLLRLGIACQELYRTIAMRTYTFTTPNQRLDVGIVQRGVQLGRVQGFGHRRNLLVEHRLGLGHQFS